ncbi:uncharacterized protein LOC143187008 [Calliopsis andreniformis]|uniref:uncharacterized protein LOC143187008 n=1 Tax=Calliopsis andreniformis TaxID=337506 RepID=UPI003FCEC3FF
MQAGSVCITTPVVDAQPNPELIELGIEKEPAEDPENGEGYLVLRQQALQADRGYLENKLPSLPQRRRPNEPPAPPRKSPVPGPSWYQEEPVPEWHKPAAQQPASGEKFPMKRGAEWDLEEDVRSPGENQVPRKRAKRKRGGKKTHKRPKCFNCGKWAHEYGSCPLPRTAEFCYRCGLRGVTIAVCPKCREKWEKEGPYIPGLGNVPREVTLTKEDRIKGYLAAMAEEERQERQRSGA